MLRILIQNPLFREIPHIVCMAILKMNFFNLTACSAAAKAASCIAAHHYLQRKQVVATTTQRQQLRSWAGIYKEGRTFKVEPLR
jgi:hypothetical protein